MADEFNYDELIRLVESAPPTNIVVCRDRESAEALLYWIAENFPEDLDG